MQILLRPPYLLCLTGIGLIVVSFFIATSTIDILVHDTYLIFVYRQLFWFTGLILLVWALLYRLTCKILLSQYLTWSHIIISLLFLFTLLTFPLWSKEPANRLIDLSIWSAFNRYSYINKIITGLLVLFILGQLLFIVNIIGGIIRKINIR